MIRVLPMKDRAEELRLLAGAGLVGEGRRVLMMYDGDDSRGWAAVETEGALLRILALNADGYDFSCPPGGDELLVLDTLMRSAASWGENAGAEKIETAFPDFYDFLRLRGFTAADGKMTCPMSRIVKYH